MNTKLPPVMSATLLNIQTNIQTLLAQLIEQQSGDAIPAAVATPAPIAPPLQHTIDIYVDGVTYHNG